MAYSGLEEPGDGSLRWDDERSDPRGEALIADAKARVERFRKHEARIPVFASSNFDVIYADPWPAEAALIDRLFGSYAQPGTLFLTYEGGGRLRARRRAVVPSRERLRARSWLRSSPPAPGRPDPTPEVAASAC